MSPDQPHKENGEPEPGRLLTTTKSYGPTSLQDGILVQGDIREFHIHLHDHTFTQAHFKTTITADRPDRDRAGVERWLDELFAHEGYSGTTLGVANGSSTRVAESFEQERLDQDTSEDEPVDETSEHIEINVDVSKYATYSEPLPFFGVGVIYSALTFLSDSVLGGDAGLPLQRFTSPDSQSLSAYENQYVIIYLDNAPLLAVHFRVLGKEAYIPYGYKLCKFRGSLLPEGQWMCSRKVVFDRTEAPHLGTHVRALGYLDCHMLESALRYLPPEPCSGFKVYGEFVP